MEGLAYPVSVVGLAATGIATNSENQCAPKTEDTISLAVQWKSVQTGNFGTALYVASWTAPKGDKIVDLFL